MQFAVAVRPEHSVSTRESRQDSRDKLHSGGKRFCDGCFLFWGKREVVRLNRRLLHNLLHLAQRPIELLWQIQLSHVP